MLGVGTNLFISSCRNLAHLTEVESSLILKTTSMTITPAILLSSPYVENKKTKNYVAIKHTIGAFLGLVINLLISLPLSKALNNWAQAGQIPYKIGSKQFAALKLITGGIAVTLTIPPTAYIVNKILPKIMKHIYPGDKELTTNSNTKTALINSNKEIKGNFLA